MNSNAELALFPRVPSSWFRKTEAQGIGSVGLTPYRGDIGSLEVSLQEERQMPVAQHSNMQQYE